MTSAFSFSFSGEDIEEDLGGHSVSPNPKLAAGQDVPSTSSATSASASAFPVQGKPLLPPTRHDLDHMLSRLPSKVAYSLLDVDLDGAGTVQLPRRELWDVRVQLMAEEDAETGDAELEPGLGKHDVKTGIYEGGFKSWESSVDLVKVLAAENTPQMLTQHECRWIELGCGTALPSLALFQWAMTVRTAGRRLPVTVTLADYNPTVLYLVTLPNFLLSWALHQRESNPLLEEALSSTEGELELGEGVVAAFKYFLLSNQITLTFLSGAWSPELVNLLYVSSPLAAASGTTRTLVAGAETIYSPFALSSFTETLLSILQRERRDLPSGEAVAIIAAKRLYFGVGGSLDDFIEKIKALGANVDTLREEAGGVRRGVVRCVLP